MKTKLNERRVILLIRYSLPILILITTLVISIFLTNEHEKNIELEKEYIEQQYIKGEKEQIEIDLQRVYNFIKEKNSNVTIDLKNKLKSKIENIYSIINSIYENNKDKKSKELILEDIKVALRDIRFSEGKGYFFIYTLEGNTILNPLFPHLEGKNLWNYQDSKGTFILQDMNKILQTKDETFYDWYWKNPIKEDNKEYLKIGFFKKFEALNIFVGTGYYLDDHINKLKNEIINHISGLRYKDDRYIFVIDNNDNLIVNKYKNLLNQKIQNISLVEADINIAKLRSLDGGQGIFFRYDLVLDSKDVIDKTSYFIKFQEWDWIIGTGFTMESVNKVIKDKQTFLITKYKQYLNNIYVMGFVFLIFLLLISYFVSTYIEKSFFNYTKSLEEKQSILLKSQEIALMGDWYLDIKKMEAYWSEPIYKLFGISKKVDKVGPAFLKEIMHKDDWSCFENSILSSIDNHTEHSCTYRIIKNDGTIIWIDCRGEYEASTNRIIGIIQDITARKESEMDKEHKEKLLYQQSKMAAMGEMIGNIAHQWRQPLSVISTASTGVKLKKEMDILRDEDLCEIMDNINTSAQYLSQTIEDFRNFFSPNTKSLKSVEIKELIEKTLKLVSPQFISKGIQIIKNIDEFEFKTLQNELIQVLINILNNSKDALMELENSENKYIFINAFEDKSNTIIEIYDNANGIEDDIILRIFEPYFTTKYKSQGTGIGLYMSQEIINKLLKGFIYVENIEFRFKGKDYKGAKFTIKLPLS